jgi:hypothetical protein
METTKTQVMQQQQAAPLIKPIAEAPTTVVTHKPMTTLQTTAAPMPIQTDQTNLQTVVARMIIRASLVIIRQTMTVALKILQIKRVMILRTLQIALIIILPITAVVMILQANRMTIPLITVAATIMIIVNVVMIVAIIWSLKTTRLRDKIAQLQGKTAASNHSGPTDGSDSLGDSSASSDSSNQSYTIDHDLNSSGTTCTGS